jgi:hypothetical protein
MLPGSLAIASSFIRPWPRGQVSTSTAKLRASSSARRSRVLAKTLRAEGSVAQPA